MTKSKSGKALKRILSNPKRVKVDYMSFGAGWWSACETMLRAAKRNSFMVGDELLGDRVVLLSDLKEWVSGDD